MNEVNELHVEKGRFRQSSRKRTFLSILSLFRNKTRVLFVPYFFLVFVALKAYHPMADPGYGMADPNPPPDLWVFILLV